MFNRRTVLKSAAAAAAIGSLPVVGQASSPQVTRLLTVWTRCGDSFRRGMFSLNNRKDQDDCLLLAHRISALLSFDETSNGCGVFNAVCVADVNASDANIITHQALTGATRSVRRFSCNEIVTPSAYMDGGKAEFAWSLTPRYTLRMNRFYIAIDDEEAKHPCYGQSVSYNGNLRATGYNGASTCPRFGYIKTFHGRRVSVA